MSARELLKPKSKEEIFQFLETNKLNSKLLKLIKDDNIAFNRLTEILSLMKGDAVENISKMNSLIEILPIKF